MTFQSFKLSGIYVRDILSGMIFAFFFLRSLGRLPYEQEVTGKLSRKKGQGLAAAARRDPAVRVGGASVLQYGCMAPSVNRWCARAT